MITSAFPAVRVGKVLNLTDNLKLYKLQIHADHAVIVHMPSSRLVTEIT